MIEVIKTRPGDKDFPLFENLPGELYSADQMRFYREEKIDEDILQSCYLVMQDGKACARAAVYNNPDLVYENKKAVCVGQYEAINNEQISSELFADIFADIKSTGATYIIGPMNGSTWNQYRFSLDHDHPNFFLEPYHHLYYNKQFADAGFAVIAKYISSLDTQLHFDDAGMQKVAIQFQKAGVTFRNIDLNRYEEELKKLYPFTSLAFQKNFLYTPISEEKFMAKYLPAKAFIDPDLVILAEDDKQDLVGYFFCVNDMLNTKEKSLLVKTTARHPDAKWKGLGHVMGNIIHGRAVRKYYTSIVHAFMNEQGASTAMSKHFYGDVYKRYALYGKDI